MNNFIQQSNEIHSILNQWYSKHYSKNPKFQNSDVFGAMADRLGNPYFERLVSEFSMEERVLTFEELEVTEELFNSFYTTLLNYKF